MTTDLQAALTSHLSPGRVAEIFYEMHTLCENDLDLTLRQKNLVSLGYLLYSSPDNMLLITTLKWTNPELIMEVHQLMFRVCEQALLNIVEKGYQLSQPTLQDYDQVMRLIRQKLKLLQLNNGTSKNNELIN